MSVFKSKGKRRKGKTGLWVILIMLAVLSGGVFYVLHTYTVKTVYVEGNFHYTNEEIENFVMSGPLSNNSLYLSVRYKDKGVDNIPFVDVMNVSILEPDTIKITVYEKALAGYIKFMDTNMYFDRDGYVVETSSVKTEGVPQITGLAFDYAVLGEPLPVADEDVFHEILTLTNLLKKYQLTADKIRFHSDGRITIYFGKVKVALGKEKARLEDKMMLLPEFLPSLEGKSGTLQLETYVEGNGRYTFKPDGEDGEE